MNTVVMNNTVDYELVEALKLTDINQPLTRIYEEFFDVVTAVIRINGGQAEDAADVFQEAVLVLVDMVKTNRFRGDSSIRSFLIGIARNIWLQEMRSRGRRSNREKNFHQSVPTVEVPEADQRIYNKENQNLINTLVGSLGETCRKILAGFYYDDLSMREMLSQFDYENEQVLRNRKSKCMKKLKELINSNNQLSNTLNNILYYGR